MTAKSLLPGMWRVLLLGIAMQAASAASALDLTYTYAAGQDRGLGDGFVYEFTLSSIDKGSFQNIYIGDFDGYALPDSRTPVRTNYQPPVFLNMDSPIDFVNGFTTDMGHPVGSSGSFLDPASQGTLPGIQLHTGWLLIFGSAADDTWVTDGSPGSPATVNWMGFSKDRIDEVYFSFSFPQPGADYRLANAPIASSAPEPETYALMLLGLACIGGMKARRQRLSSNQS